MRLALIQEVFAMVNKSTGSLINDVSAKRVSATAVNRPLIVKYQKKVTGQQGFALITAVFILLLLSAVAATMASTSITHDSIAAQAVRRANTELALKSATQWYLAKVSGASCESPVNFNNKSLRFDQYGKYTGVDGEGIVVTVTACQDSEFNENGAAIVVKPASLTAEYRVRVKNPNVFVGGTVLEAKVTRVARFDAI